MSDFDIARENMVHNQLMANNVVEEHILEAFRLVPKEIFLPFEKKPKAYIDEDIKIMTRNPNAKLLAKNYIKVYKDTYRGAPDMTDGKIGEFIYKIDELSLKKKNQ